MTDETTQAATVETREWTYQDRAKWPSGPWDSEPDKRQWTDPTTGLPCLIVRNHSGGLCGYVGVPPNHPHYGADYDDVPAEVHGGLTFAGSCQEGKREEGICHVVAPGQPDDVWWLGFDCVHYMDTAPVLLAYGCMSDGTYRDVAYVTAECERLATFLAEVS